MIKINNYGSTPTYLNQNLKSQSPVSSSGKSDEQSKDFLTETPNTETCNPLEMLSAMLGYCFSGCAPGKATSGKENIIRDEKSQSQYHYTRLDISTPQLSDGVEKGMQNEKENTIYNEKSQSQYAYYTRPDTSTLNTTSQLPDEIKKEMEGCENSINEIIGDVKLSANKVFSEINKVLDSKVNVGISIVAPNTAIRPAEPNDEILKRNCRIALTALLEKEGIQNIKLNIQHLRLSLLDVDKIRLVDLIKKFFEKNENLAHIDLSLKGNSFRLGDLVDLGIILEGKKLYSLDLSGNITDTKEFNDGLKEILKYFNKDRKINFSKLYLDDWDASNSDGYYAKFGLELLANKLPEAENLRELSLRNLHIKIDEVGILIPPRPTDSVLLNTSIEILDLRGHWMFFDRDIKEVEIRVSKINAEIKKRNQENQESRKEIRVIL